MTFIGFSCYIAFCETADWEIRGRYDALCAEWTQRLEEKLYEPPTNALSCILTVANLRVLQSRSILFANLAYPSLGVKIPPTENNKFWSPFISVGPYKFVENTFPVFMCLERIGFDFKNYVTTIERYGINRSSRRIFASMGVCCAGNYYVRKMHQDIWNAVNAQDAIPIDLALPNVIISVGDTISFDSQYSPNTIGVADPNVALEYDTMQKTLLLRFTEELASSSAEIADTIRTMGHIRSLKAIPLLTKNLTICPQVSTNAIGGYVFPAAEALIEIGPAIGYCFSQLEDAKPFSVEESLWLRISHELYPEGLEYDLMRLVETNDTRAARLLDSLTWRRLDSNYEIIGIQEERNNGSE